MELYRLGVGMGQGERRPDAAGRANRSKQIGVFGALIRGLTRPDSASGPLPNLAVLLADARPHPELCRGTSLHETSIVKT